MAFDRDPKRSLIDDGQADLISNLPSNVIDNIMDRLPLLEAARLCTLSKDWKLIWLSFPNLKLDAQFFREVLSNKLFQCYEFNRILSNIVLSHNGPIPKFFLHIPYMDCPPAQDINAPSMALIPQFLSVLSKSNIMYICNPEISPLISHLSRNGIREITLNNCGSSRLKLPSYFFSCVELEKLKLCRFDVNIPPSLKIFKSVTRIELEFVTFIGRSYESFISSCPALETLVLKGIIVQDSLVINAPNLKLIEVEGTFTSICLKGCLALSSVTIGLKEKVSIKNHNKACELVKFLSCSCKLQELNLRDYFFEFLGIAGLQAMFSNSFDHLRKLQLSSTPLMHIHLVTCTIRIIQSCPNMEELKISFRSTAQPLEHEITCNPRNVFQRLRTVYLTSPTGLNLELRFIEFLLSNAPILEKLYIPSNVNKVPTLASRLTRNLLLFSRASSKAQILFFDQP